MGDVWLIWGWEGLGYEVYERRPSPTQAFLRFPGNIKVELSEDPTLMTAVAHHHIHLFTEDVAGMKQWYVETFGGKPTAYDASLLSDGTLRVLAIAAAMLSAPEGSLVVIEQIDNICK